MIISFFAIRQAVRPWRGITSARFQRVAGISPLLHHLPRSGRCWLRRRPPRCAGFLWSSWRSIASTLQPCSQSGSSAPTHESMHALAALVAQIVQQLATVFSDMTSLHRSPWTWKQEWGVSSQQAQFRPATQAPAVTMERCALAASCRPSCDALALSIPAPQRRFPPACKANSCARTIVSMAK